MVTQRCCPSHPATVEMQGLCAHGNHLILWDCSEILGLWHVGMSQQGWVGDSHVPPTAFQAGGGGVKHLLCCTSNDERLQNETNKDKLCFRTKNP